VSAPSLVSSSGLVCLCHPMSHCAATCPAAACVAGHQAVLDNLAGVADVFTTRVSCCSVSFSGLLLCCAPRSGLSRRLGHRRVHVNALDSRTRERMLTPTFSCATTHAHPPGEVKGKPLALSSCAQPHRRTDPPREETSPLRLEFFHPGDLNAEPTLCTHAFTRTIAQHFADDHPP
jgi:hypothetical protein